MSVKQTVYLIDDDASVRTGIARLLRTAGYKLKPFESGKDFLAALDSQPSGCIVLDARMPEMTGEELLQALSVRDVHLPIIFVTADDTPELRQSAENMKAVGFFRKPVDGSALLDAIKWALKSQPSVK